VNYCHRRLPHVYTIEQPLFVTFRLHDSLPAGRKFPREFMTSGQAFVAMDRMLDNPRSGPTHLQQPRIAIIVRGAIQHGSLVDYDLHAWVIMPNHVHLLVTPHTPASTFLRRLKGYSARQANQVLRLTGQPFWQDESYDHAVRTGEEFRRIERYIVTNAVNAGLAQSIEAFPWSSAALSQG
jgi:REP element-mobilizing transposase RayT